MTQTLGNYTGVERLPVFHRPMYKALAPTGEKVVLKSSDHEDYTEDALQAKRLLRHEETVLHAVEGHPSICRVVEYVWGTPHDLLVLRHAGDKTLADVSPQETALIARALASVSDALLHTHAQDVIHRDIKPKNIAIDENGNATLIDWNAAYREACPMPYWVPVGTGGYMGPEQVINRTPFRENDVHGLGATFYRAMTGTPAFKFPKRKSLPSTLSKDRIQQNFDAVHTERMHGDQYLFLHPHFSLEAVKPWRRVGELIVACFSNPDLRPGMREIRDTTIEQFGLEGKFS